MIYLTLYQDIHQSELNYFLDDEQRQYTALPSEWFDVERADIYRVVMMEHHQPVGFFVLDNGEDKYKYADNEKTLLLRSMSVNPAYQGKGYAKHSLLGLADFLHQQHIKAEKVVLGVHHNNTIAQTLYEKVGFIKMDRTYMGHKGMQYIYELNLY